VFRKVVTVVAFSAIMGSMALAFFALSVAIPGNWMEPKPPKRIPTHLRIVDDDEGIFMIPLAPRGKRRWY
jgi:hypothetical protein